MFSSTTEKEKYVFRVKEYSDGTPFIMLEPENDDLTILQDGFLSFDLNEGSDLKEASEIAEYMNDNLDLVCFTKIRE
jgi:hypothetical protein